MGGFPLLVFGIGVCFLRSLNGKGLITGFGHCNLAVELSVVAVRAVCCDFKNLLLISLSFLGFVIDCWTL